MRASFLDFRVRREARHLVRKARSGLAVDRTLKGKAGELAPVVAEIEAALRERDRQRVRRQLPVLDALVDELFRAPTASTTRAYIESIGTAVLIALALRAFVVEAYKIPSASMYPTLEINDHIFVNKFIYGVRIPWTMTKLFELRSPHRGEVIVFIYPCEPEHDFIKRVAATAGQTVETRCGVLYVDGVAVPDTFVDQETFRDYDERTEQWATTLTQVNRYHESVPDHAYSVYGYPHLPTDGGGPRNFPLDPSSPPQCNNPTTPPQVFGRIEADATANDSACGKPGFHYVVPPGHVFAMGDNRDDSNDSRAWGSVPLENVKGNALFIWLSYGQLDRNDWKSFIRFERIGNFVE
jgi:signal peptidase I